MRTAKPTRPASSAREKGSPRKRESRLDSDPRLKDSAVGNEPRQPVDSVVQWSRCIERLLRTTFMQSTWALVEAVEARDPSTRAHSITVAAIAEAIGRRMAIPARRLRELRAAALLHDVGKIGIPDAILNKVGKLTREEFEIVKTHPAKGVQILGAIRFFSEMRPIILHHHEAYDGGGYPCGLRGEDIPFGARVLSVADAVETMLSARTYKPAFPVPHVRAELTACSGRQFDPAVTSVALEWLNEPPFEPRTAPRDTQDEGSVRPTSVRAPNCPS